MYCVADVDNGVHEAVVKTLMRKKKVCKAVRYFNRGQDARM